MSEFEPARNTKNIVLAVVVIAIIAVGGIGGYLLFSSPATTPTGTETTTGTTTQTTTAPSITLVVLTRHDVAIHSVFESAFLKTDIAKQYGITDIDWKTPSAEYWDDLINAGTVDVCWGGGPTIFDQLMRDGYLRPLTSDKMAAAAARVNDSLAGADMKRYDSNGDLIWIAAAISSFGFTVNHAFLDDYSLPVPHKWTDLANATYGSLLPAIPTIAMGNAPDTTSNTRIYEIITQGLGWDAGWATLARMAGSAKIYLGSVETQSAAENGEVGISMSIDFYGYVTQSKNPDCEYIIPEGQTIVNGDPIAVSATAPHPEAAEAFLDWVLTPEAQSLWLNDNILRMPVMREAFDQPLGQSHPQMYATFNKTVKTVGIDFNDTLSLEINAAFVKYFESVFTDAHTELVQCWDVIVDAYLDGKLNQSQFEYYANLMGQPVTIQDPKTGLDEQFTIEYARAINHDMIYDATYASQVQSRWTAAAKAHYNDVRSQVEALLLALGI
ncbi:MAG: ABC transporter substrate-binding protein [Candidatus Thorarchaeota archaeon]